VSRDERKLPHKRVAEGLSRKRDYRESNKFCHLQTHLGRAIYAPKMEELCQNQTPRRSSSERREAGRPRRERPGAFSWFVLCRVAKNEHPKTGTDQRATKERSMIVKRRKSGRISQTELQKERGLSPATELKHKRLSSQSFPRGLDDRVLQAKTGNFRDSETSG